MDRARQTYGEFIPTYEPCDKLANVYVYKMGFVPEAASCQVRHQLLTPTMQGLCKDD
jgi:hypothetical protein